MIDKMNHLSAQHDEPAPASWRFEYLGEGPLIVEGTASGAAYRFTQHGQVLEVAYEDSGTLLAVPQLRPR